MKILSVAVVVLIGAFGISGQTKKSPTKTKPVSVATTQSTPKPEPVPTQQMIVEKTNGDRLTGLFVSASTEKVTLNISDSKIEIPFTEIASIRVNEAALPDATASTAPVSEGATLAIEAAIVYRSGGAQPLARADMALFDKSLSAMLRDAGVGLVKNFDYPTTFGFAMQFPSQYGGVFQKALPEMQSHKVLGFTTDFQGRALLNNVKEGSYWIICYYRTRGGFAVWDLPIKSEKVEIITP